jgi:hypothetical protein
VCVEKQPKLTNKYEYIVYHVTRAIIEPVAPGIFVQYDKPLIPVSKPLGSDKQRGDVVISGLLSFPEGVGISVKGQDSSGTTDRKVTHHIEYELVHYPTDIKVAVFLGKQWKKRQSREFVDWAYDKANVLDILVFDGLDKFVDWLEDLAEREKDSKGTRTVQTKLFEVIE